MKKSNLISFAAGIVIAGGSWFLRTRPFWDDRTVYSDAAYNAMWNITGGIVVVGCIAIAYGIYGILKDLL